jgi:RND family efflux transporter MFP subunit
VRYPVEVTRVESRRVEYTVAAVGSVEAFERVQVTARVAGVVERVRFAEGERVRPGQMLVEVEPERYQIAVDSARATLEKTQAAMAVAEAGLARRQGAVAERPGLIPGEEIETWRTRVRTAAAEAAQARAALRQAELNLRDAYARAPSGGLIETRSVETGQYVQPGKVLATLVRREPLLVRFQVPEADAARLRPRMQARFRVRHDEREMSAKLVHVAQAAEGSARMVAVTAEVDDPRKDTLRPGAFAEVTVPVGATAEAAVIPQTAVRPSERGFLAFVVEAGVARERVLKLGMRTADGRVEVRAGLRPGETLVVRGAEALRDGATVRIDSATDASAPAHSTADGNAPTHSGSDGKRPTPRSSP